MFTQLSNSQQAVLEAGQCPHCQQHGTVREEQTRNGPTVVCTSCKKKVYRPRGRAVAKLDGLVGGAGGQSLSAVTGDVRDVPQQSDDDGQNANDTNDTHQHDNNNTSSSQSSQTTPDCPKCHGPMVKRSGKYGDFYGCLTYPKCDGTAKLPKSQTQSAPNAGQRAGEAIGKPLSQSAQDALNKMQQALRQEMQQALQSERDKLNAEHEQAKQDLQKQVQQQVESLRPKQVEVKTQKLMDDGKLSEVINTVPKAHKLLPEVLRRINCGIRNFLFVGPAGSGKTTLCSQIALALAVAYSYLGWSGGTTEGRVLGRPTPDGRGFTLSEWLKLYTTPSVFNHDEIDASDPNVAICMNAAIENGLVTLPCGVINRDPMHIVTATANVWGYGADMLYCGRNQLDAAFRDRFVGGMFHVDYDTDLETQLVPENDYRQAFWDIRSQVFAHKLRRVWGTRALVRGAMLHRGGYTVKETLQALTVSFNDDEMRKVGLA